MTKETETQIASDEDLTRLFAGKPTQYRKSKSLPKFTGEAMRTCATINRIFFDDPDEAYRLFHELVPDAGEGVQFTPPFNVDYGIGLTGKPIRLRRRPVLLAVRFHRASWHSQSDRSGRVRASRLSCDGHLML